MPNLYYLLLIFFWLLMYNYCLGLCTVQNPTVCNFYLTDLHLLLRCMGHRLLITVHQPPLSWPFLPESSISLLCLMSASRFLSWVFLDWPLSLVPCGFQLKSGDGDGSECVADPSPLIPLDLLLQVFGSFSARELDANSVWPVDSQEQDFVL